MEEIAVAVISAGGVVMAAWFTARAMIRIGTQASRTERDAKRVTNVENAYEQVIDTLREELARAVAERDEALSGRERDK
jgi:hypothetical protein